MPNLPVGVKKPKYILWFLHILGLTRSDRAPSQHTLPVLSQLGSGPRSSQRCADYFQTSDRTKPLLADAFLTWSLAEGVWFIQSIRNLLLRVRNRLYAASAPISRLDICSVCWENSVSGNLYFTQFWRNISEIWNVSLGKKGWFQKSL